MAGMAYMHSGVLLNRAFFATNAGLTLPHKQAGKGTLESD